MSRSGKKRPWVIERSFTFRRACDIVITDPCYLAEGGGSDVIVGDVWDFVSCIFQRGGMQRYTIYGDWYCTVYRSKRGRFGFVDKAQKIGEFAADSAKVCVCRLRDAAAINPGFPKWAKENPACVTIIRQFSGKVSFIERENAPDEDGFELHELRVHGSGTRYGAPFAFESVDTDTE